MERSRAVDEETVMLYRHMNSHSDVLYVGMTDLLSITDDHINKLAAMFRLIGDPSRLRIILACLKQPICVSDVATRTRLSPSLVSHHLRLLRAARIVRSERRGKQVFYAPADDHVRWTIADMIVHVAENAEPGGTQRRRGRAGKIRRVPVRSPS
jgi:ArsR family transcriptional regulator, lead/cadmium/zinc/bismuth-responsive transcriptional repressor